MKTLKTFPAIYEYDTQRCCSNCMNSEYQKDGGYYECTSTKAQENTDILYGVLDDIGLISDSDLFYYIAPSYCGCFREHIEEIPEEYRHWDD